MARRLGEDGLFEVMVEQNYALFLEAPGRTVYRQKTIGVTSPKR